jgi:hypothetical protein
MSKSNLNFDIPSPPILSITNSDGKVKSISLIGQIVDLDLKKDFVDLDLKKLDLEFLLPGSTRI